MQNRDCSIGEAAKESGVKVPTIRYYEEIGLMPGVSRSDGNRRIYDTTDLRRLGFIRHARELGFDIAAIRAMLRLQDEPDRTCESVHAIAITRLADVRKRIASLKLLQAELENMVRECAAGRVGACRVIETLADSTHDHGRL